MRLNSSALAAVIERLDLTHRAVAKKVGVSDASIGAYVGGYRNPNPRTIGKLARALGVPVESLMESKEVAA